MPSSKTESGIFNVECLAFPPFSENKDLLKDKTCHIIEPYDDGKLVSVFVLKDKNGSIVKVLDKNGKHIGPDDAGPIDESVRVAINIAIHLRIKQYQLFYSIKGNDAILVDVFDGKTFISPGMLSDIYGKRLKIQETKSTEKYNPEKDYGDAIIKPTIVCYKNNNPVYIRSN